MVSENKTQFGLACVIMSLNPCFSGRWSRSSITDAMASGISSLNPCFSGRWSRSSPLNLTIMELYLVLILVLVEDGLGDDVINNGVATEWSLNPCFSGRWSRRSTPLAPLWSHKVRVLILVLVEDGLGEDIELLMNGENVSLNPCFSGRWSRRMLVLVLSYLLARVLILVLVEDGLGERILLSSDYQHFKDRDAHF